MEPGLDDTMNNIVEEIDRYRLTNSLTTRHRKESVLKSLTINPEEMRHYQKLLTEYRYVDEVDEFRVGSYLRFFKLNTETLSLGSGGFLVDFQLHQQQIILLFKNRNRFFRLKMDESMFFQKNTPQEKILVQILDQINSKRSK
jgi:hypothetical protein